MATNRYAQDLFTRNILLLLVNNQDIMEAMPLNVLAEIFPGHTWESLWRAIYQVLDEREYLADYNTGHGESNHQDPPRSPSPLPATQVRGEPKYPTPPPPPPAVDGHGVPLYQIPPPPPATEGSAPMDFGTPSAPLDPHLARHPVALPSQPDLTGDIVERWVEKSPNDSPHHWKKYNYIFRKIITSNLTNTKFVLEAAPNGRFRKAMRRALREGVSEAEVVVVGERVVAAKEESVQGEVAVKKESPQEETVVKREAEEPAPEPPRKRTRIAAPETPVPRRSKRLRQESPEEETVVKREVEEPALEAPRKQRKVVAPEPPVLRRSKRIKRCAADFF
ncbi:Inverted formin-2 [Loxospora ochrophaea]|nr:Inverted formin-2 [Loxospora ochrophaea]